MRKVFFVAMLAIAVLVVSCSAPTPEPTKIPPTSAPVTKAPEPTTTKAPAPTSVPATSAPVATKAPEPATTKAPAPTTAPTASTSAAAEFYKGKTITLYTSGTPGSASDMWARTIAKYLPDITGAKVVVQNESAGNGKVLFNQLQSTIKADGLALCYTPVGTLWPGYMTNDPAVQYDITKYVYLGGVESGNYLMSVAMNSSIKTVDDLKKAKNLKFAHSARTSTITLANALAIDLLGLDGKIILGFDGATGRQLAVQQGEAEATVMAPDTAMVAKQKGILNPIMQVGVVASRTKPGDDVPSVMELVKSDSLTDMQKRLIATIDILADSKSVFVASGTPQDRMTFLADAFKKVYDSADFKADLKKTIGEDVGPYVSGDELSKRASNLAAKKGDMKLWDDLLNKYVK